jgi:hypothetical protein
VKLPLWHISATKTKIPGEYNVYALGEMKAENVSVSLLVKLRLNVNENF